MSLDQEDQTAAVVAWPAPVVVGMIAQTRIVRKHPPSVRKRPMLLTIGKALFANSTTAQHDQEMMM